MASGSGSRPSTSKDADRIRVTVKGQSDRLLHFEVKRNKKLTKLMDLYCGIMQLNPKIVQFVYNGRRINRRHTVGGLGMEDGDEINAMLHVHGGGCQGI